MSFLEVASRKSVQKRSIKTALVVGSILAMINYADVILNGEMQVLQWLKLGLTYLVPYSVATWAAVKAIAQEAASPE